MLLTRPPHVSALALATMLFASFVASRASADNKTVATQLFDDAKKLMDSGKAAEACPKLEESMRLDPADGTELRLAYCYELTGRTATAWGLFKVGLEKAKKTGNQKRIEFATEHLAIVEPRLSHVTLSLDSAAKVAGLEVKWDYEVLGTASLGTALPVDPGAHKLIVSAPGKKTFESTITINGDGKNETVKIAPLADAAVVAPTSSSSGPGALPWIVGGAGVVFLGATVFSRIQVSSAQGDRQDACAVQHSMSCDDTGVSKIQTWDKLSFVFGGLAAVGIGVSVVMLATSGSKGTPGTKVGGGPAAIGGAPGFQLQGSF